MNSLEAQYRLAEKMPNASLANILRGMPSDVEQSVAMMILRQRQKMKTATDGAMAGAEAQQPSVKDRVLQSQQSQLPENQGIGTLPSPNMGQVAAMAQGGVVGFAGGGDVQHFLEGGNRKLTAAEIAANDYYGIPAGRSFNDPVPGTSLSEKYGSIYNPIRDAASRFFSLPKNKADEEGFVTAPGQMGIPKEDILSNNPTEEGLTQLAGPQGDVAAPVSTGRPRGEAAPVSASGIKLLPTQDALPMTDYSTGPDVPASPSTAQQGDLGFAKKAVGVEALQRPNFDRTLLGVDVTKQFSDQMTETFKSFSLTPDEKSDQKFTRLGTVALSAAKELLASGRPGMSSVGAALGQVGTMAQQYAKEDREDKRALLGVKMSMLAGQAQMAQGNIKNAIDMFNHGETMTMNYAKIAMEQEQHRFENDIKNKHLGAEERKNLAHQAGVNTYNGIIQEYYRGRNNIASKAAAGVEQRADTAATKQFIDSQNAIIKAAPYSPAGKEAAKVLADPKRIKQGALELRGKLEMGLGAVPPTSVQKNAVSKAEIDED